MNTADPYRILLTNSSDIYGGGEFYVLQLAGALLERGHEVWVSCRPQNALREKCEERRIPTIPLDFPPNGRLAHYILELKRIGKENRIGIIHSNSNYDRTAGAFAARLCGAMHVTNVHSFHSLRHNVTHWLRNAVATDHFIVDGECVKDLLIRSDGIPASRISVVHLGVDPELMKTDAPARKRVREEFGLRPTEVVIGNVARLVPFKGHEVLLRSFARAVSKSGNVRLLLVGDGPLKEELAALTGSLGLKEAVVFAGFRDDLNAVYSAIDVYVHASIEGGGETFPFAVLQALAQELPVAVTDVGDVAAMVEDGNNGFLIRERDESGLADAMERLAVDSALRARMGGAGRNLLLRRFTLSGMVDAVEAIYREVAGDR